MSLELAKIILEKELSREDGPSACQVHLVSGEPFIFFDEIKELIEYSIFNANNWHTKFHFLIGTNLTLLSLDIKRWLKKNRLWVVLVTSLDGTRDAHNHYRCDSYDTVIKNLVFYKRVYPDQGYKMTIGPDTISSVYDSILNIESLGLCPSANVVFETIWGELDNKKECLREFSHQLELLVEHYVHNLNLKIPNLLSLPIHKLLILSPSDEDCRWCGSGLHMRAYDTDGRELTCHRFSCFCSNKIYEGSKSIGPRMSTECDQCMYITACTTCRGYNWQVYGNPDSRTNYHCEFIKLQMLATAKLQYLLNKSLIENLFSGESLENVPISTLATLKAANLLLNSLDDYKIINNCKVG
jgi:sulfatase maturation enzyme AslB (radical SAM superfamily)